MTSEKKTKFDDTDQKPAYIHIYSLGSISVLNPHSETHY